MVMSRFRSAALGAVRPLTAFAILILASSMLLACSSSTSDNGPASRTGGAPVPATRTGQEIYASNCAVCHGDAAQGQPSWHLTKEDGTLPPPPLNGEGHTWHHPDGFLYRIVSLGGTIQEGPGMPSFKSAMPAFGQQLSHEEIVEVIGYVKGLWGDKTSRGISIRESQEIVSERDPFPPGGE